MVERTPSVPIRRFARKELRNQPQALHPNMQRAVIDFVEAAFWMESGIGDPDWHALRVVRKVQKLGLTENETVGAHTLASDLYSRYKTASGITPQEPLTREVIRAIETNRRLAETRMRAKEQRKRELKTRLKTKFKKLMSASDDELRITNSNQRLDLDHDPVYANVGEQTKVRIRKRTLTEQEFKFAQERAKIAQEDKNKDPDELLVDQMARLYASAESGNKQAVKTLERMLGGKNDESRYLAADTLSQLEWQPQTAESAILFHLITDEWYRIVSLGEQATPVLLKLAHSDISVIREAAVSCIDFLGLTLENLSLQQQAFYYAAKGRWGRLIEIGEPAVPALAEVLKNGDPHSRQAAARVLEKIVTPQTVLVFSKLTEDNDSIVRDIAIDTLKILRKDPIYVTRIMFKEMADLRIPVAQAILTLHPEWRNNPPSDEILTKLSQALCMLPPVGGKIAFAATRTSSKIYKERLTPSMTVEEQIRILSQQRQKGKLGEVYIHQLTVQGRLPDRFKYVALALILHSPYPNNWHHPFFEAPWGKVAPLVHDGGNVDTGVNPWWKQRGRTDFLQRIAFVHERNLETLEQLTPEELVKQPIDLLANARAEEEERERLIVEAKAYQRLALALHACVGSAPEKIPVEKRNQLAKHWWNFQRNMDLLLRPYGIAGAASVSWFHTAPHNLEEWETYGPRQEAEWEPIQTELVKLEEGKRNHPEIRERVRQILTEAVETIDQEIGLIS